MICVFESPTYGAPVGYRFSRPSPSNAKRERHAPDLLLRNGIGNGLGKRGGGGLKCDLNRPTTTLLYFVENGEKSL